MTSVSLFNYHHIKRYNYAHVGSSRPVGRSVSLFHRRVVYQWLKHERSLLRSAGNQPVQWRRDFHRWQEFSVARNGLIDDSLNFSWHSTVVRPAVPDRVHLSFTFSLVDLFQTNHCERRTEIVDVTAFPLWTWFKYLIDQQWVKLMNMQRKLVP